MTTPFTIEALLPVPAAQALPVFDEHGREMGFSPEARGDGLFVQLVGGTLLVTPAEEETRITVTAEDAIKLQMLRDFLTEEIAEAGLTPHWLGTHHIGRPINHSLAHVVDVTCLSPAYIRVTVQGADLARFETGGLHFRLLFGPEGADWPMTDANGVTQWPGGAAAWHRPVYTTRALSHQDGTTRLSFDVFLHAGGRTTDWCMTLTPGTAITLAGPGGEAGLRDAAWVGLIGDETAVPVIARLLAKLAPEARGHAVLVVPTAADAQDIPHPPGVRVEWACRDAGETPLTALNRLQIPAADRSVFFAAEQREAQAARKALAAQGLGKTEISAAAYWTAKG